MKITQEEVSHVAKLSKLAFSPEETAEFATTLSKIVDMVELLNEVDTEGVPFTSNVISTICEKMWLSQAGIGKSFSKMYLKKSGATSKYLPS